MESFVHVTRAFSETTKTSTRKNTLIDLGNLSLATSIILFLVAALAIAVSGTKLTGYADQLADRTGLGEAITGAVLLGASTSLSGIVVSITAATQGNAELAMSNALGGIAVQTAFLAIADIAHREANLEHAAASAANMMQGTLLLCLLSILLLAHFSPNVAIWGIHPVTPVLVATYIYGLKLVRNANTEHMWRPKITKETREDKQELDQGTFTITQLSIRFLGLALLMGFAGWTIERAATLIAESTGITQTMAGVLFTSVATSLPELVTSIVAVRRGALTLAVGGIIGGNAFDTLFAAASDIAYREGSIYHAMSDQVSFWIALTMLMTASLIMGLIRREKHGIANIGFESFLILVLYIGGVTLLFLS